jgi:hypothetical protein
MARKKLGKPWLTFKLFGLQWKAYIVPQSHPELVSGDGDTITQGICYFDRRVMFFTESLSDEQLATTLAHEIQHAIEEHADVDYSKAVPEDVADRMTDQVARGWLYVIRDCPELLAIFNRE